MFVIAVCINKGKDLSLLPCAKLTLLSPLPSADSSSFRVDTAVIKQRVPILLKYLDSDTEKELQALYALQASIVKLDQPPSKCCLCAGDLSPHKGRGSCGRQEEDVLFLTCR